MNTIHITVPLNNKSTTFAVIPADNTEGSYSTYFQLLLDNKPYCEIRFNDDSVWEVCKGQDLPEEDLSRIIKEVESLLYRKPASYDATIETKSEQKQPLSWIDKILNAFHTGKSAA
jgi:hypothetical protein